MAHDVFISHSASDKTLADAVCACLEARKIRCWIAPRDVLPGTTWPAAISSAISTSKVVVLIFSSHANQSEQVMREVELAAHHKLAILPVRVEDVSPQGDLKYFLSATHWLNAVSPPVEQHLDKIAEAILGLGVSSGSSSASSADGAGRNSFGEQEEPRDRPAASYRGVGDEQLHSGRNQIPGWLWGAVGAGALALVVVTGLVVMNWKRSGRPPQPATTTAVTGTAPGVTAAAQPVAQSSTANRLPAIPPAPSLPPPDESDEKLVATWRAKLNQAGIRGQLTAAGGGKLDLDLTQSPITSLNALAGMPLHTLKLTSCPGVTDLTPLRGMSLVIIDLTNTKITDVSPLAGMPLKEFHMHNSLVRDFSSLKGMPLKLLDLNETKYVDLSHFGELPMLGVLGLFRTSVKELSAMREAPIHTLQLSESAITDLGALPGMEIEQLELDGCRQLRDLSPLLQCLKLIHLSVPRNATNLTLLRNHPSLKRLSYGRRNSWQNETTPQEFWAAYDKGQLK